MLAIAEKQASYIQASSHPADTDRLVLEALLNPSPAPVSGAAYGVGPSVGDLLVTQKATPNMSVDVAAGHVWIDGTEAATQGAYHGYNDATKNLVVAASDPTNPRKDLVVAKVQDAAYSGATNAWSLAVVTGTAAASPAEPAVPANAVVLAMVSVAALATTITNANITDRRRRACGLSGVAVCLSTTRPAAPYTGQVIYETDTDRAMVWDGAGWKQLGLKYDPPACRVYHSAAVSIANNALTILGVTAGTTTVFNSERYDTDTMHDTVTNPGRITFKTAGLYIVTANIALQQSTYTIAEAFIRLNGATYLGGQTVGTAADGNDNVQISLTAPYKFAVNDYVEMAVYQINGGGAARNLLSTAAYSPEFSAIWVGRG